MLLPPINVMVSSLCSIKSYDSVFHLFQLNFALNEYPGKKMLKVINKANWTGFGMRPKVYYKPWGSYSKRIFD